MTLKHFDPDRHDTQLVAAFERRPLAESARAALLGAGIPADAIDLIGSEPSLPIPANEGIFDVLRRLFAPTEEAFQLSQAVERGQTVVVVHPQTVAERETAIEVLEGCGPIDLEERDEPGRPTLNHAALTRADMAPNPLTAASEPDPAMPAQDAAAEIKPAQASYTYGIPEDVVRTLTPEEQILAQAPDMATRQHFVRIVEERLRVGWRDETRPSTRVRSYVAERPAQSHRVELQEEEIGRAPDTRSA